MLKLENMAEEYAVHVSQNKYQCPACGEETLWKIGKEDYLAGAKAAIEMCLTKLKEEAAPYDYVEDAVLLIERILTQEEPADEMA